MGLQGRVSYPAESVAATKLIDGIELWSYCCKVTKEKIRHN